MAEIIKTRAREVVGHVPAGPRIQKPRGKYIIGGIVPEPLYRRTARMITHERRADRVIGVLDDEPPARPQRSTPLVA